MLHGRLVMPTANRRDGQRSSLRRPASCARREYRSPPISRRASGLELGNQSWVGPGAHLVHHFLWRGQLLNFVGWAEHDEWNREDWTDRTTVARGARRLCGLARAGPNDQRGGRDLLHLGIVRSRSVAALGRSAGRPYWTTPATRCTRSWARARRWRSRMARRSPPVSARSAIRRRRCCIMSGCVWRASPACRKCRAPTRPAFTCTMARRSRRAMAKWAKAADRSPDALR